MHTRYTKKMTYPIFSISLFYLFRYFNFIKNEKSRNIKLGNQDNDIIINSKATNNGLLKKNEKSIYDRDYSSDYGEQYNYIPDGNPLVDQLMFRNKSEVKLGSDTGDGETDSVKTYPFSSGNKVAINYHESEEGKNLYIIKDTSNSYHSGVLNHFEPP